MRRGMEGLLRNRRLRLLADDALALVLAVASLLGELDLRERVKAVVFAYESGVVRPGA